MKISKVQTSVEKYREIEWMRQGNDRLRGPAFIAGHRCFHRHQWGVSDDKNEFTHTWNQKLPIVTLSDRYLFSKRSLYLCGGLRSSAVNFSFLRTLRVLRGFIFYPWFASAISLSQLLTTFTFQRLRFTINSRNFQEVFLQLSSFGKEGGSMLFVWWEQRADLLWWEHVRMSFLLVERQKEWK